MKKSLYHPLGNTTTLSHGVLNYENQREVMYHQVMQELGIRNFNPDTLFARLDTETLKV